jgi:hypothetical protein
MSRKFTILFLTAAFLAAPAAFGPAAPPGLSGSAQAALNNTTTRSNTQHSITFKPSTGNQPKVQTTITPKVSVPTPHH